MSLKYKFNLCYNIKELIRSHIEELIRPHGREFQPATNYAVFERSQPTGGIPPMEVLGLLDPAHLLRYSNLSTGYQSVKIRW